jgi:hypothetical protein
LVVRRAFGYKLERAEKLLSQLLTYVENRREEHLRIATMLAWATLPSGTDRGWSSYRPSIVRGFASHMHTIDPATEVPSADLFALATMPGDTVPLLGRRNCRVDGRSGEVAHTASCGDLQRPKRRTKPLY